MGCYWHLGVEARDAAKHLECTGWSSQQRIIQPEMLRWGFPGGGAVKHLPARTGDTGLIPGSEDPLEKEMATCSSILAWEISWTEEPGGLQSIRSQSVGRD